MLGLSFLHVRRLLAGYRQGGAAEAGRVLLLMQTSFGEKALGNTLSLTVPLRLFARQYLLGCTLGQIGAGTCI